VLELLVGEAHQRLERSLVAEPVVTAHLGDLRPDEALDQAEQVGVAAPLDLAEAQPLLLVEEGELIRLRQAVGQEFLAELEGAAADHVAVDLEAQALGGLDAARVALGVGGLCSLLHGYLRPGSGRIIEASRRYCS